MCLRYGTVTDVGLFWFHHAPGQQRACRTPESQNAARRRGAVVQEWIGSTLQCWVIVLVSWEVGDSSENFMAGAALRRPDIP